MSSVATSLSMGNWMMCTYPDPTGMHSLYKNVYRDGSYMYVKFEKKTTGIQTWAFRIASRLLLLELLGIGAEDNSM